MALLPARLLVLTILVCLSGSFARQAWAQDQPASPAQSVQQRLLGVYKADGSLQCQSAPGMSLDAMAKELTGAGVTIQSQEKRKLPLVLRTECDTPTGMVNYYSIALADLNKVNLDTSSKNPFRVWAFDIKTLLVAKGDGEVNCDASAISINAMAQILIDVGIVPIDRTVRKRTTRPPANCGAASGNTYVFRIPATQLLAARKMRFSEIPSRTPAECEGLVAPEPGSSDYPRLSVPQSLSLILPPLGNTPGSIRGHPLQVTFSVKLDGTVDTVTTEPVLPLSFAKTFLKVMMEYRWSPGIFDGCAVPGKASIHITLQ